MLKTEDIRDIYRAAGGARGFCTVMQDLLEGKDQQGKSVPRLAPGDFSLRSLWEGLVGPCEETLPGYTRPGRSNYLLLQEAVDSTAFPSATGVLIAAKVIEAYNATPMIGDQLVTTMSSRLKQERIVGMTSLEGPTEVPEAMPYQESGFQEKYVTTDTAKKGRILEVTEEAIFFDQTGQILMRAQRLGEMTAEERELTILAGVVDVGSAAAGYKDIYRPSGSASTLYATGNSNYQSTVTALVDWTDIDEVLQYAANNLKDDRAIVAERLPITFNPKVLLTARKKAATAARILAATTVRVGNTATTAGVQEESGAIVQQIAPGLQALTSPLLDFLAGVTNSRYSQADDWFLGDFKRQFIWQEIWPLQTLRSRQDDEAAFRRDIVARFKVRYYGGIAAIDTKYVIKVKGA
ncbi:MAG TPA: hypothetical protein VF653_00750 [Methylomirabilota bacterium]